MHIPTVTRTFCCERNQEAKSENREKRINKEEKEYLVEMDIPVGIGIIFKGIFKGVKFNNYSTM